MLGDSGQAGAAVRPVFAREISAFERELAPIRFQVTMECTVMKEKAQSNKTARVSMFYCPSVESPHFSKQSLV